MAFPKTDQTVCVYLNAREELWAASIAELKEEHPENL